MIKFNQSFKKIREKYILFIKLLTTQVEKEKIEGL